MAVAISIDRELCMGSGNCAFAAPHTFDVDDEMKAIVLDGDADPEAKILLAAEGCPTRAITVERDGVVVFPT